VTNVNLAYNAKGLLSKKWSTGSVKTVGGSPQADDRGTYYKYGYEDGTVPISIRNYLNSRNILSPVSQERLSSNVGLSGFPTGSIMAATTNKFVFLNSKVRTEGPYVLDGSINAAGHST